VATKVGVEAQTVRAVGMIQARKRELRAELDNAESEMPSLEAAAMIRGLDEATAIIMLAVVAPEAG
jgi:hypothetical protein